MINTKKLLLVICVITIPAISVATIFYLRNNEQEDVKGVSNVVEDCTPYITNMMPNSVKYLS